MKLEVDEALLEDTDVITICVSERRFYAPRALLVHHSAYLAQRLDEENVMMFSEFHDVLDVFELGLDLLKGKEVEVSGDKYKGLLKFSVLCQVENLYQELLDWLKEEFRQDKIKFMKIYEISQFIIAFDPQRTQVRELCCDELESRGLFIIDKELEHTPESEMDNSFIELLVNPRFIWTTLSLLHKIVSNRSKAELVLGLINNSAILSTLRNHKLFTVDFLSRLRILLAESETRHLMILIKIQEKLLRAVSTTRYRLLPLLACDEFLGSPERRAACLALSPDKLLKLKKSLNLQDVVYCEIVIDWLKARFNDPSRKAPFVYKIWEQINFQKLSRGFVYDLKQTLQNLVRGEQLSLELPPKNHNCVGYGFYLTEHQTYSLRMGHPITLEHHCNICECEETTPQGLCLQLSDNTPCYNLSPSVYYPQYHYHTLPNHWWLSEDGTEIISLITNSWQQIKTILSRVQRLYVCCMGPMVSNPVLKPQHSVMVSED